LVWAADVRLTLLSIAYPLAPVGANQVGGAEQILTALDRALVNAGHTSIVIAADGSETAGSLIALPRTPVAIDDPAIRMAHEFCRTAVCETLARHRIDVVHMHGVDFYAYLPPPGPPVLATLHMPTSWYPAHALRPQRPATWLNCVSRSQHQTYAGSPYLLSPIANGVAVHATALPGRKRDFALVLARICPEKGIHIALDAAKRANVPLVLAGQVFPYREHQDYFERMVRPRLDDARRYIGPVGLEGKRHLLADARCLVVASLVPETSSLVALEALAAGTPVVAFSKGALPEVIDHGRTGYLAADEQGLAQGIRAAGNIDSELCRAVARKRFPESRMIQSYFAVYRALAASGTERPGAVDAA
jgi:glycosyltransferase involved in cell wall biosynthesis